MLLHHSRKHSVVWPPARWHGRYLRKETHSCIIQPLHIPWPLPRTVENVCPYKKLHMNVDGSFIHNWPNLEASKYSSLGEWRSWGTPGQGECCPVLLGARRQYGGHVDANDWVNEVNLEGCNWMIPTAWHSSDDKRHRKNTRGWECAEPSGSLGLSGLCCYHTGHMPSYICPSPQFCLAKSEPQYQLWSLGGNGTAG